MQSLFDAVLGRGFVAQVSHQQALTEALTAGPVPFYLGFDPTGESLHAGHLVTLALVRLLAAAGHPAICLIGSATARIGDPSGKASLRQELEGATIERNATALARQVQRLVGDVPSLAMVDNADWLPAISALDFLQHTGRHFRVGRMLSTETYKSRLESGLTFFEFAYQLLQAFDFSHLASTKGCRLQLGGDDQWSSMLAGVDLCRRRGQGQTFALTVPLSTTADGRKMGKTEGGAIWLDSDKTSVSDFYQYWINVADADLPRFLRLLTELPLVEIAALEAPASPAPAQLNAGKAVLAWEVTAWVHGAAAATGALVAASAAFGARALPPTLLPSSRVPRGEPASAGGEAHHELPPGPTGILTLMVQLGWCRSNNEARRLVRGGSVSLDGVALTEDAVLGGEGLPGGLLRAGKKRFVRLRRPA